jgi:hypothetical protein
MSCSSLKQYALKNIAYLRQGYSTMKSLLGNMGYVPMAVLYELYAALVLAFKDTNILPLLDYPY